MIMWSILDVLMANVSEVTVSQYLPHVVDIGSDIL